MKFICVVAILVTISAFAVRQAARAQSTTVKHVAITNTPSNSGQEMFRSYCAACHGLDAKGSGPAASALKTPPTDLTTLAQKKWWKVPGISRSRGSWRPGTHPVAWHPGHADLGPAVLEHQPGR